VPAVVNAPTVDETELTAQALSEKALSVADPLEKVRLYTEAIRLKAA